MIKLNLNLALTYYLDHVTCHVIVLLNFGNSANWWRIFGVLINK